MSTLLLLSLLVGCRCGSAPTAPPPPEPLPTGRQPDDVPVLFQEIVEGRDAAAGLRVRADGLADQAVGTARRLSWYAIDRLTPDELAKVRDQLASDDLAKVPDALPPVPSAGPATPRATFRFETPSGTRTVRSPTHGALRLPVVEHLEELVHGAGARPPLQTRWELHRGDDEAFDVPCDPEEDGQLRPIVRALLDRGATPDPATSGEAPVRVRVIWSSGGRVWTTTLHEDGLVLRSDERGGLRGFRVPPGALAATLGGLDALDPTRVSCPAR